MHDSFNANVCPLCDSRATSKVDNARLAVGDPGAPISFSCRRCRDFQVTRGALEKVLNDSEKSLLSGLSREWSEKGNILEITEENFQSLKNMAPTIISDKIMRFVNWVAHKAQFYGRAVEVDLNRDCPVAYAKDDAEFRFMIFHASDLGLIQGHFVQELPGDESIWSCRLTAAGWTRIETSKATNMESDKAFVAMWFAPEIDDAYSKGIEPAVKQTGFRAIRVNNVEHIEKIDDRIIAEIKESRFVIADFTGQRGGVYFEAGFARGLGLPVIWTCRNDHLQSLHFDTRQFNHIDWKEPQELKEKLIVRIRASVGYGPHKS